MAIAFVKGTGTITDSNVGSTSGDGSFGSLPSAGNLIVVGISLWHTSGTGSGVTSVSDNQGNTYTQAIWDDNTIRTRALIYYAYNIGSPSGTFTVTVNYSNSSGNYAVWSANEYSGAITTDPIDVVGSNGLNTGTTSTVSTNSTTTQADTMAFAVLGNADQGGTNTNIANTASYTERSVYQSQLICAHQACDKIIASAAVQTCTWSHVNQNTSNLVAAIATFKATGGGGGGGGQPTRSIHQYSFRRR